MNPGGSLISKEPEADIPLLLDKDGQLLFFEIFLSTESVLADCYINDIDI